MAPPAEISWTAPVDGEISDVQVDVGNGTAVLSTIPQLDISTFSSVDSVQDQLIAAAIGLGSPLSLHRALGRPVLEGESVYFSADTLAVANLTFIPSAVI